MEELYAQMKKVQILQKEAKRQIKKGDISSLTSEINKDLEVKKFFEELRKKMEGDK